MNFSCLLQSGVSAGTLSWGVLTPEEDAKLTLGLVSLNETMHDSLIESGAAGVMRAGMSQLLDVVLGPLPPNGVKQVTFVSTPSILRQLYIFLTVVALCMYKCVNFRSSLMTLVVKHRAESVGAWLVAPLRRQVSM